MSQVITLGNTILGPGKRGSLKPLVDPDGKVSPYYRMPGGGFNIPNRHGITYPMNDYLKECMGPDSDFERRIKDGQMFSELDHPKPYYNLVIGGQIVRKEITELWEWVNRLKMIDMDNIAGHIRKIHWDTSKGMNGPVLWDVEICPFGDKKWFLEESLPNPDINTALSVRTVTAPLKVGDTVRDVEYWSTVDVVPEQGVLRACKHLSAGMESFLSAYRPDDIKQDVFETTVDELIYICDKKINNPAVKEQYAGNESFNQVVKMVEHFKNTVGRRKAPAVLVQANSLRTFF